MRAFKLYSLSNFQIYNTVLLTVNTDFPSGSAGKESTCNVGDTGDLGLIPRSRRFPGGGHGNPLQYSCQENPMDRGDWWATVHGVTKNRTQLKWLSLAHYSVTVPCIIYPEFIHFKTGNLYLLASFTHFTHFHPQPLANSNQFSVSMSWFLFFVFFFFHLKFELLFSCWYILDKSFISYALHIFSPSFWLIFSFSWQVFHRAEIFNFNRV